MNQTIKQTRIMAVVAVAFGLALAGCDAASTDDTAVTTQSAGGESITIWADSVELFFEHPALGNSPH